MMCCIKRRVKRERLLVEDQQPAKRAIEVVSLSKHFGTVKALDDVSFGFESDTIVSVLGHNGAGKTTLF